MATAKKIVSITFLAILSIVILVSGIYFLSFQSSQLASKKIAEQIISGNFLAKDIVYKINNGQESKSYDVDYVSSSTVFSVLQILGQKEKFTITYKIYPEMGVLVQGIDGLTNGTEDKYWQYWTNGVLGDVACDKKFLKAGDKVEWRFDIAPVF